MMRITRINQFFSVCGTTYMLLSEHRRVWVTAIRDTLDDDPRKCPTVNVDRRLNGFATMVELLVRTCVSAGERRNGGVQQLLAGRISDETVTAFRQWWGP